MKLIQVQFCGYSKHYEPFRQNYGHGLDTYIIRLQSEETSQALVDGEMIDIAPGDLLLFKPGDIYDLQIGAPQGTPARLSGDFFILSTGPGMDTWWTEKPRPTVTKIVEDGRIITLWQQLIMERRRLDGGDTEIVSLMAWTLLKLLDRAIEEAPATRSESAYNAIRMRNYIEEHAAEPLKLEDVARHAGLSVSRTVHLFKQYFGSSIMEYVGQIRMAHALNLLLHSPMSLEQIAVETGLGSYTYFHRVFRARFGISPGAYRKNQACQGTEWNQANRESQEN